MHPNKASKSCKYRRLFFLVAFTYAFLPSSQKNRRLVSRWGKEIDVNIKKSFTVPSSAFYSNTKKKRDLVKPIKLGQCVKDRRRLLRRTIADVISIVFWRLVGHVSRFEHGAYEFHKFYCSKSALTLNRVYFRKLNK